MNKAVKIKAAIPLFRTTAQSFPFQK